MCHKQPFSICSDSADNVLRLTIVTTPQEKWPRFYSDSGGLELSGDFQGPSFLTKETGFFVLLETTQEEAVAAADGASTAHASRRLSV